jgi:hypothetical protein
MRSFERRARAFVGALLIALAWVARADAQQAAHGFAVERFYPSAPGAGWFVMDTLDMHGGLGGAAALTVGYAHKPLRIGTSDGSQHLTVVADQAFADLGFAATYDRLRLYVNFDVPLVIGGQSGTVGDYAFTAPAVDPSSQPDTVSDARIGFDARLVGDASSPLRLGASVQLYVPNGNRTDYDTDGSYRAMGRVLVAGDVGRFTYAGQLGLHVRPLDDSPTPGSPRGSELLFGAAGGAKLVTLGNGAALFVGPELYGASALGSPFGSASTAFEGLLSGRVEGTGDDGAQLRVRLGTGAGLDSHFGAPEWRLVFGVEIFNHHGRVER